MNCMHRDIMIASFCKGLSNKKQEYTTARLFYMMKLDLLKTSFKIVFQGRKVILKLIDVGMGI